MATTYSYTNGRLEHITETLSAQQAADDLRILNDFDTCEAALSGDGSSALSPELVELVARANTLVPTLPAGRALYWRECFVRLGIVIAAPAPSPAPAAQAQNDSRTLHSKKLPHGGSK